MADSQDKKNTQTHILSNFKDDLDAMLDEAGLEDDSGHLLDDAEAIDQLFLDDDYKQPIEDELAEEDEIDKLLMETNIGSAKPQSPKPKSEPKLESKHDLDTLLDQANAKVAADKPESPDVVEVAEPEPVDEPDEFASFDDALDKVMLDEAVKTPELDSATSSAEDEFDEFDDFDLFESDFDEQKPVKEVVAVDSSNAEPVKDEIADNNTRDELPNNDSTPAIVESAAMDSSFEDAFGEMDDVPIQNDPPGSDTMAETAPESAVTSEDDLDLKPTAAAENIEEIKEEEDDDFLIMDFDISSEGDEFNEPEEVAAEMPDSPVIDSQEPVAEAGVDELDDFLEEAYKVEADSPAAEDSQVEPVANVEAPQSADQSELLKQIGALWAAQELLKQQFSATASAVEPAASMADELDMLTKEQRSLRRLIEHNTNKVPTIVYVATALGALALIIGGVLLALHLRGATALEELQQRNTQVEKELADIKNIAVADNDIRDAIDKFSEQVEQINTKLAALEKAAPLETKVVGIAAPAPEAPSKFIEKRPPGAPAETAKKILEPVVIDKPAPKHLVGVVSKKTVDEKPPEKKSSRRPSKVIASVVKNPTPAPDKSAKKAGRWAANLVSFRQDWYAQRKAFEFGQRGINAVVVPVEVKGETWYRLSVRGFANREEANNYAAKAKRQLNLTSVWVTVE